ncbi:MAG: hypothetical protein P8184_19075 [Calditrichia bacterium]
MWSNWVTFILGIWLFISGLIPSLQGDGNLIATGILAVIFGFIASRTWQGVVNGVLGIWIFLSGIWFMLVSPANFLIVGAIMAIVGIWGAIPSSEDVAHHTA